MNKKIFFIAMLSIALVGCDRHDNKPDPNHPDQTQSADNTGTNVRDRNTMARTPMDQSESEMDRTITQRIRQAIVANDSLSTNAKNIKIITVNGMVTLRGPVANEQEKAAIVRIVGNVQGIKQVDNQIEVTNAYNE